MRNKLSLTKYPKTGYGVFTNKTIFANEKIMDLVGEILPYDVADKKHYLRLSQEFVFQYEVGSVESYLNHSCSPNCYIRFERGLPQLVSLLQINLYSELTINYNSIIVDLELEKEEFECECESVCCIRNIKGFGSLSAKQQDEIKFMLSPFLLDLYEDIQYINNLC